MNPRMPAPTPPSATSQGGFILVGVVMFVLALTILGLSLYGLSSYEGQFFEDTHGRDQALYAAESGQEIVKLLLARPGKTKQNAHDAEGQLGILRATAIQYDPATNAPDSTGPMNWSRPVEIRVLARSERQDRLVMGQFDVRQPLHAYKRLFTATENVICRTSGPGGVQDRTTDLVGDVWQPPASDTTWQSHVASFTGTLIDTLTPPAADVNSFFAAHYNNFADPTFPTDTTRTSVNLLQWPLVLASGQHTIDLTSSPPGVRFYQYAPSFLFTTVPLGLGGLKPFYEVFEPINTLIKVSGTAILMVPGAIRFNELLTVQGSGPDPRLVIVTGPHTFLPDLNEPNVGTWCFGGLTTTGVTTTIVMVSSGDIDLWQFENYTVSETAPQFAAYGRTIKFMGPTQPHRQELIYGAGMDDEIDTLLGLGALPPASATTFTSFTLRPGTWRAP